MFDFDNRKLFGMANMVHKYYVSWVTCNVAEYGLQACIDSWNEHPIPGREITKSIKLKSYMTLQKRRTKI